MKQSALKGDIIEEDDELYLVLTNALHLEFNQLVHRMEYEASDSSTSTVDNPYPRPPTPEPVVAQSPSKSSSGKYTIVLVTLIPLMIAATACIYFGIGKMLISQPRGWPEGGDSAQQRQIKDWSYKNKGDNQRQEKWSDRKSKSFYQKRLSKNYHHSILLKNIDIPIFLDIPGTSNIDFSGTLSKCLELKSIPVDVYMNNLYQNKSSQFDFLTLKSLCGFNQYYYKRLRFFFLIENPALRFIQAYNEIRDTNNKREYMNWLSAIPENNNVLTRSILCKKNGDLNNVDLDHAKTFLKENAYVRDFLDYTNATVMLQRIFKASKKTARSSSVKTVTNCMDSHAKKYSVNQARLLQRQYTGEEHLQKIYETNFYDFSIYLDYVKDENVIALVDGNTRRNIEERNS